MGATSSVLAEELRVAGVHDELAEKIHEHRVSIEAAHQMEEAAHEEDIRAKKRERLRHILAEQCMVKEEAQLALILDIFEQCIKSHEANLECEDFPEPDNCSRASPRLSHVDTSPTAVIAETEVEEDVYAPQPRDTSAIELPEYLVNLTELLAENTHEEWAQQRMQQGWSYGSSRNDTLMHHPCLVPYDRLSEEEKEYDRLTAMQTLKLLLSFGYKIEPPPKS